MTTKNRFTIFLPDDVLRKLDSYARIFAQGDEESNRSKIIANLIDKYVPDVSSIV